MEISTQFAYLPNGIIRHIVAYTGATYKKRNGKYMGQIPKDDRRYALLLTIPTKSIWTNIHTGNRSTLVYFHSYVRLARINDPTDRFDLLPSVYLDVHGMKFIDDPLLGNLETIEYDIRVCDWKGNERKETFVYYRYDEKYDQFMAKITECKVLLEKYNRSLCCVIRNTCTMMAMFAIDYLIQEFCS